jgi:hypothetical protein
MRTILCGLLNDGLFRGRLRVQGFEATPDGQLAVFQHAQTSADADLPAGAGHSPQGEGRHDGVSMIRNMRGVS